MSVITCVGSMENNTLTEAEQNLKDKLTPEVLTALYEYAHDDMTYWDVFDLFKDLYKLLDVRGPWLDITEEDRLDYFEYINKSLEKERELKQKKINDEKQKLTDTIQTKFGNFEL